MICIAAIPDESVMEKVFVTKEAIVGAIVGSVVVVILGKFLIKFLYLQNVLAFHLFLSAFCYREDRCNTIIILKPKCEQRKVAKYV